TPRGDGNPATIAPARADDSGRQTQNPERGRKPHGPGRAADGPGGRQTQNPERGRKLDCANWLGADPGGRQTQNPERGRKLHIDFLDLARREDHVVRPKTPREDGNSSTIASMSMSQSSSRQTQNPERGRKHFDDNSLTTNFQSRQTQNPERGRKQCWRRFSLLWFSLSSDPKPREGTETHTSTSLDNPADQTSSDPKPREGTETGNCVTARLAGRLSSDPKPREGTETPMRRHFRLQFQPVVRPKTPRGDGNCS
ncbi:hypothetical protein AN81_02620, partial [Mycobacterium tuberculosis M1315]